WGRLYQKAIDYCGAYIAPAELRDCEHYLNTILERLFSAHPLTAIIGLQTRALVGGVPPTARPPFRPCERAGQFSTLIGLVTVRPRTRLVWLMPALAIFHLPVASLLGLATFVAEAILCLKRRRLSMLLGASALTFAIAFAGVQLGVNSPTFAPSSVRIGAVVSFLEAWPGLTPALLSVAFVALLAT